jgi:hypothetical protein
MSRSVKEKGFSSRRAAPDFRYRKSGYAQFALAILRSKIASTGLYARFEDGAWDKVSEARKARGARGIVAEILFYRETVKKIEAESPVFCPWFPRAKNAPGLFNI